jgi:hypothetical protein
MVFRLVFIVAVVAVLTNAKLLRDYALHPPFTDHDNSGYRRWQVDGAAKVHKHFVRLTSERTNSQGWIWSSQPLKAAEVSIVAKVRLSGHNTESFGESLGIWVTTGPKPRAGGLYGFTPNFKGVGVVLLARGGEAAYQQVQVFLNNGHEDEDRWPNLMEFVA